nr:GNAT family N-acetyltransferase [Frankia sp. Cppng1_Ct_nod]
MPKLEPVEITAGKLHLRPWIPADIDEIHAACQDPDIQRWTRMPTPYMQVDATSYVTEFAPRQWEQGHGAPFAVLDATSGSVLASVALMRVTDDGLAAVGYWCAPGARGQGVVTQAVGVVGRWAFHTLGIERLEWTSGVGNWASRRVAEKNGFTIEGTLRRGLVLHGTRLDCWIGSLLSDD